MAAPSTLPISSQNPVAIASTPAARAFFSRLSEGARNALSQRRPWLELVDRNSLAKPESFSEATARIRKNWAYFRINYVLLLSGVLAFSLLSHPVSLFLLVVLLGGWIFLYLFRTEPLVVFNRTYSDREVLGIMSVLTIVIVFLTSVGSLLISALMFGLAIVSAHGAFRVPEDLFLDEQEPAAGFLSFLSSGTPQPPVVSHV
eukprot:Gb_38741 [translate_table: standard]